MKNKKNGFTLAEVMIAMSIVGIIAAIVVPQLVTQIEKEKAGPMLGKIVNQMELGCRNMLQADFDNSFENGGSPTELLSLAVDSNNNKLFTPENFAKYVGADSNGKFKKFGASYTLGTIALSNHDENATIVEITIDTNGAKKPNSAGKDQFKFYIKNNAHLVPYGVGSESTCTGTQDSCAARVVADGFKIKY